MSGEGENGAKIGTEWSVDRDGGFGKFWVARNGIPYTQNSFDIKVDEKRQILLVCHKGKAVFMLFGNGWHTTQKGMLYLSGIKNAEHLFSCQVLLPNTSLQMHSVDGNKGNNPYAISICHQGDVVAVIGYNLPAEMECSMACYVFGGCVSSQVNEDFGSTQQDLSPQSQNLSGLYEQGR